MRATEFLIERISSRVFHYTRVTTALKILQSGRFELSHTLGTSWEAQFAPKGYPYFLSTTRTRHGGYHGYLGQDAVLFELDGDFYNQRYPGKAVDYWNNRDPMKDHHKAHEAEDRIFSRENAIPAAIRVIDLYIAPDADEAARARTRQVIILAKKAGIAVNLFNDQAAWRQRDTRKAADVGQLKGQDPARGYVERRRGGYLKPWMELMQAKTKAQLSKAADSKRYDLQYTYDKQGLAKSLAVDLSNARKPGPDADRNNAIRIIKFMQQNRLSTVDDFVNFLADKWKNIKEGVAEDVGQPTFHVSSHDDFETAFEVEMVIDNNNPGFFSYQYFPETDDVENDVYIHSDQYRGQGFGKLLLLKAIETAQQHGLPFKPDRNGISPEQRRVYQSLLNDRLINIAPDSTITLRGKQGVAESVPQPGPSSGAPKQFGPDAKIQTRQMTAQQLIDLVPGLPYYNNVVDDWDAKDYSWGVTKKVIEYATYLKKHPETLAKLPPIIVLNGKFEDGAHRVSAIWLLQQRMDPKNPLWANAKLNVQFVKQDMTEGVMSDLDQDRQDANWDAIVGYVINGLKKNQDVGHMELALYKWGGKELVDVDQELEDRGFRDLADLASHIQQHGGRYQPPTNFGLDEDRRPVYHLPQLVLVLDPHFFDQMGRRELDQGIVDQLLDRLKNITRELQQFEPGQKIWVNSPKLQAKLGMRRQMDRNGKMTYLLKTIVKNPRWDNPDPTITVENFADGKVKGRSRPGRVERSGASCNGSVTDLRAKAKKYGGEKGKMYHWCANMKSGKNK